MAKALDEEDKELIRSMHRTGSIKKKKRRSGKSKGSGVGGYITKSGVRVPIGKSTLTMSANPLRGSAKATLKVPLPEPRKNK